jgi:hypothetical protein
MTPDAEQVAQEELDVTNYAKEKSYSSQGNPA